ncbi:hypothetical protein EM59_023190 [Vibrio parahaemolyticus]|uniref:ATP-binding protein n=1 Tax=Vibrio parahaemolyticus TaxID=670 RepID=UPI0009F06958|nr:ATP-binding protein [Vibrio parahaemolyticus]EGQ9981062.1 hypothetical protein [Vibrio parahaemolyticus]ELB2747099.1 ATP-binding protein [Vibrio parahaemolyticus]OQU31068.1 hypothetical protein EM59_023190 [Vibrio parahaemolyticus]
MEQDTSLKSVGDDNVHHEVVRLKTGIEPRFLADTLTTDIELTDALFDLIDNSIDAARDEILTEPHETDSRGLPSNYSGYEIKLRFSRESILIEDNCTGVDTQTLEENTFYTGRRSDHKYGIGYYGLGLKRALLKAGSRYGMITDNGEYQYKSRFDMATFASDGDVQLLAERSPSTNRLRTVFVVSSLYEETIAQIHNAAWIKSLIKSLEVRYSIFIRKGLKIKVVCSLDSLTNTFFIDSTVPQLRNELIAPLRRKFEFGGVSCDFETGIHERYLFPGEYGHTPKCNEELTDQYGVYYIFNDRVIVEASTEKKHGFTTNWHSEYGGFVCLAHVTGSSPKDLPWNTAKTDVKLFSPLFIKIRENVEPLAKEYRSKAKKLINIWTDKETKLLPEEQRKQIFAAKTGIKTTDLSNVSASTSTKKTNKNNNNSSAVPLAPKETTSPTLSTAKNSAKAAKNNSNKHSKSWKTLLPDHFPMSEDSIFDHLALEATTIVISEVPNSASLLYRSLFEAAFKAFAKKHSLYEQIKEHYYKKGEGRKKNHNSDYIKNRTIDLSMCAGWIVDNNSLYPSDMRKRLSLCAKRFKQDAQVLNGLVHGNRVLGNANDLCSMRDATIELLEFLANGKPILNCA